MVVVGVVTCTLEPGPQAADTTDKMTSKPSATVFFISTPPDP
jgi:hypothetical protein